MNDENKWDEPDWNWIEPVDVEGKEFRTGSSLTVVLLGGCIISLVVTAWYLFG